MPDYTRGERKDIRQDVGGGFAKGAATGAAAGAPLGVPGALVGGAIGGLIGGISGFFGGRAGVTTDRAALAADRQREEAIDRAQEFEREQLAATEGKTLARDRLISGDTALVQATDVGGGTSYDRWYRQNFTA